MVSVGGLIAIVATAQILHVGGAFGYRQYIQTNPQKVIRCYHCKSDSKFPIVRWALVGLVFISWVFSIATTAACTFLTMEQILTVKNRYTATVTKTFETSLGLRSMGDGECQRGSLQDDRFEAAFSFAVLNCLLTSIGLLLLLLIQCGNVFKTMNNLLQDSVWTALQWILYSSLWCCILTFYVQESTLCQMTEDTIGNSNSAGVSAMPLGDVQTLSGYNWQLQTSCSLGGAGSAQVVNVVLLVIICIMTMVTPQPSSLVHVMDDNEHADYPKNHHGRAAAHHHTAGHHHHTSTSTSTSTSRSKTKNAGANHPKATRTKRTDKHEEEHQDEQSDEEELY